MKRESNFETVNSHAAGIDIGAEKIFVSVDGSAVVHFSTYTSDYHRCIDYLKGHKIERVAMEATGVYWIALYEMLERNDISVCLVNPKEVKQVKGRKTDVKDCQWIQKLFSAGLLRESYVPAGKLREVRMMIREREDIIEMGSTYVNKMQKALELMNIKLTNVLSQIQGKSGRKMIEAIIQGERDPEKLLSLCYSTVRVKKSEDIKLALQGNYNETWIFILSENYKMWQQHQAHLHSIDKKIESLLEELNENRKKLEPTSKPKSIRHHTPEIANLNQKILTLYGVNISSLSGLTDYSALRLVGETGNELSRFPTAKHFISWCQLSPRNNQSGKMNRKIKMKIKSRAGQIFREAAQSLINSKKIAIGAFMRKIRSKKGAPIAIKAGARKIAAAYYNIITKGTEYVEEGIKQYELKIRNQEIRLLTKLAEKHNMSLLLN
ncbi:MAG TPA: IS110 family transposase [Cyclobacteriaceae bacterium]